MQGSKPAKGESDCFFSYGNSSDIPFREYHEKGYPETNEHSNDGPNDGSVSKISNDFVVVRELFYVHVKGFGYCLFFYQ